MKPVFTTAFVRKYDKVPQRIQLRFEKQLGLLLANLQHPSLRAKKVYSEQLKRWVCQARINGGWRFYFDIEHDALYLLTIQPHPK